MGLIYYSVFATSLTCFVVVGLLSRALHVTQLLRK